MNLQEYAALDATGLAQLIARKEITPVEAGQLALKGLEKVDGHLNGSIQSHPQRVQPEFIEGLAKGPLWGVPCLRKDLSFAEAGELLEMGSLLTRGFRASVTSTSVERLIGAGALFVGRTTTPEFGTAGITESRIAGITRNPWDVRRTPGGSSGGSAALVAAGVVPIATAGDSGGSTRGPASYCGLVGLKQSRGRIPTGPNRAEGNNGMSAGFVVTRTVRDCALCLDLMSGPAPGDPYGIAPPSIPYVRELGAPVPKLRIARMDRAWSGARAETASVEGLDRTLRVLEDAGAIVEDAYLDLDWASFLEAMTVVFCANLTRGIDALSAATGRPADEETLMTSTLACHEYGKTIAATELLRALETFNQVCRDAGSFFETYDLLASPSASGAPPLIDSTYRMDAPTPVDPIAWQAAVADGDPFMPVYNVTGQPAISLPLHRNADGLPIGIQLASRFGDEATLIRVSSFLELAMPWSGLHPDIHVASADIC